MKKIGAAIAEYFHGVDVLLMLMCVGASALSALYLSAIRYHELLPDDTSVVSTQIGAAAVGFCAAIVISLIDYRLLLKLWRLYLPVCVGLVALTFTGLARVRGDNQAWIDIPLGGRSFSLQPSELLKICFITTLAMHIAKAKEKDVFGKLPNVLLLCIHGGAYAALIRMQGDDGSALIYIGIFAVMVFMAGIGVGYIVAACAAAAAAVPILWIYVMTEDQKLRFLVLGNPEIDMDRARQQNDAFKALVYGGMRGNGIFNFDHIYVYVSDAYNDFIFSFIGETSGFVGCLGVVALLAAIAFKLLADARLARDDAGKFLCVGVAAMVLLQTIVNLGMCIGLLPVIGVTLPFFSAGGSSVLSLYLGIGLVLSVYSHSRKKLLFD